PVRTAGRCTSARPRPAARGCASPGPLPPRTAPGSRSAQDLHISSAGSPHRTPRVDRVNRGRVLVVEDERAINDALTERLRAEGYDVGQAFDGPSALVEAAATPPDVVVLDVMLPG